MSRYVCSCWCFATVLIIGTTLERLVYAINIKRISLSLICLFYVIYLFFVVFVSVFLHTFMSTGLYLTPLLYRIRIITLHTFFFPFLLFYIIIILFHGIQLSPLDCGFYHCVAIALQLWGCLKLSPLACISNHCSFRIVPIYTCISLDMLCWEIIYWIG